MILSGLPGGSGLARLQRALQFGRFLATAERSNRIAQALQPWVK